MKNVIALGLLACAAFVNVAHATEAEDLGMTEQEHAEYLANMICGDGPGEIRNARWDVVENKTMTLKQAKKLGLTRDEYYNVTSTVLNSADAQFTGHCKSVYVNEEGFDFSKQWTQPQIYRSIQIQEQLGKQATKFYTDAVRDINSRLVEAANKK